MITFGAGFLYYLVRFVLFAAIAGAGLFIGKKLRDAKTAK